MKKVDDAKEASILPIAKARKKSKEGKQVRKKLVKKTA